ncbi:hypothetical protein FIBSPDRAFT_827148 [Athelia psychrophila]|uniref:Uncharacterized protein n=1 Tax=Athelia psychrophila TaxID=1759441 RepID=A0A166J019_9AGAM|nr:hypothetical protein FIBSPDRAFT_827148 [Fibularhizoctonia sp. CBS 109695]
MAQIIRSAKSGSDWGTNELLAFNIRIEDKTDAQFFGQPLPANVNISSIVLNHLDEPQNATKSESDFFAYLEDAMTIPPNEESFVADFAVQVLKLMGFDAGRRVIHTRKEISFEMCGQRVDAKMDVCVMERGPGGRFLLLVQEDKRHLSPADPEPQLVAEAIAAFSYNNNARRQGGLQPLHDAVVPGITMVGSAPVFYKIPVTQDLLTAIITAQYPQDAIVVERFFPPVNNRIAYVYEGMKPLDNRLIVLKTFEAFKQLLP